jgi:hypothetical protein
LERTGEKKQGVLQTSSRSLSSSGEKIGRFVFLEGESRYRLDEEAVRKGVEANQHISDRGRTGASSKWQPVNLNGCRAYFSRLIEIYSYLGTTHSAEGAVLQLMEQQ